ncbi:MAG: hypothetical protein GYB68_07930, partial [Chloroflexi bacterium]|nr:hypothetical protein [Chloroflexota bacterium]
MKVFRWLTTERLVIILAFLAVLLIAVRTPIDPDTFWHLRAGQWQVENLRLLNTDLFSHSRLGETWINHSWLSQTIIYGAYAGFGHLGVALYTAILATGGLAFIYRILEGDVIVKAFALILGALTASVFWAPRPQMMSFFLSAVVFSLIWDYLFNGRDHLWWIPAIMLLWVNLHGGFAIGFILLVFAIMGEGLRWIVDQIVWPWRDPNLPDSVEENDATPRSGLVTIRRLVIIGLVSAVAVSINPYGPAMLAYPFQTVGIAVLQD